MRRRSQAILTAAWSNKVPLIQKAAPAELAASVILAALDNIGELDSNKISVIEFCSGAGGPTPSIERIINRKRIQHGKKPIPFVMSDLHPDLDSWMALSTRSTGSLTFIPQSVDAVDPPVSAISNSSARSRTDQGYRSNTRVFRLYCLSFHHFDDETARKVLQSTMDTADGFAILELQDRYLSSFALMLGHVPLIFATSLFRYWRDVLMLLLVYVIPLVPAINTFDGIVSCLRTRNFREVIGLMNANMIQDDSTKKLAEKDDWVFQGGYEMHSWPVGYMNFITGHRRTHGQSQAAAN